MTWPLEEKPRTSHGYSITEFLMTTLEPCMTGHVIISPCDCSSSPAAAGGDPSSCAKACVGSDSSVSDSSKIAKPNKWRELLVVALGRKLSDACILSISEAVAEVLDSLLRLGADSWAPAGDRVNTSQAVNCSIAP
jgi:hypothetical protein